MTRITLKWRAQTALAGGRTGSARPPARPADVRLFGDRRRPILPAGEAFGVRIELELELGLVLEGLSIRALASTKTLSSSSSSSSSRTRTIPNAGIQAIHREFREALAGARLSACGRARL